MKGDFHLRFRGNAGVKLPGVTRLGSIHYMKDTTYKTGTLCSVEGCSNLADYEVFLYDYYTHSNQTFYETDFTCPFLCSTHMEENEAKAEGERKPRGRVLYPYTNEGYALGYSKYSPLKEIYTELFKVEKAKEDNIELKIDLDEINEELIKYLSIHPEFLKELDPRKFEILIAGIFHSKGYEVTLTPQTRDGGKDIIALYKSPFGHQLYFIECKRFTDQKVGVELVRGLYGVKVAESATQAILVTTSTFTKDAINWVKPRKFELELKDYKDIQRWCEDYGK